MFCKIQKATDHFIANIARDEDDLVNRKTELAVHDGIQMPLLIDEMPVDDLDRFVAIVFQALATELEDRFRLHDQATTPDRSLDTVNTRRCSSFRLSNDQYQPYTLAT